MLAVEFETIAENGIIRIPDEYIKMVDGDLKIIILKQETPPKTEGVSNSFRIQKLLRHIRGKKFFHDIDNPVEWQRTIRDEWSQSSR